VITCSRDDTVLPAPWRVKPRSPEPNRHVTRSLGVGHSGAESRTSATRSFSRSRLSPSSCATQPSGSRSLRASAGAAPTAAQRPEHRTASSRTERARRPPLPASKPPRPRRTCSGSTAP
jgi:hypothetical protein